MSELTIRNIRKSFGAVEILKGIDITLADGDFLVLLGASGCGKSTLLNLVAGLAEPTEGDILIDGRSVVGTAPRDRDIAMVFQSYALYPNLTVERNVGFSLEMRGVEKAVRRELVMEAARLLKIEGLLKRKPSQLSGGQRQRVAIGRALVRQPKVFLFDEPLSNLDAKLRMEMRAELKRLHKMLKATVVYVTHDQIEAMTLATKVALMRDGHVEQLGTPSEIYNRPATRYVAEFVGAPPMNILPARIAGGKIVVENADVPLASAKTSALSADGDKLSIGIRPEAVSYAGNGGEAKLWLETEIAELTGPELQVTGTIHGHRFVAALPPTTEIVQGTTVPLGFEAEALHMFGSDGRRLPDETVS
ncbi:MAG: sn-glycerol-3-phosphate ABC transporter ATP-binding protein UgpC [Rhizobiaceae bacterium]|nr:sn-glycerol-3-phosphate ABC transporter ATP-binding protein UgpC [Rhizobiaceae bacterium]